MLFLDPRSFPLTDATSLLMRLQLEPEPIEIDLKDRWREVGNMYQNLVETDSTMFIFDDFHALLGCLYGNERYAFILEFFLQHLIKLLHLVSVKSLLLTCT